MWDCDAEKQKRNSAKHGVEFSVAVDFDWEGALTASDERRTMAKDVSSQSISSASASTS
jgi:uncharacterized DUF497 family protein